MEDLVPIAPRKKKVVHYHELQDCKVGRRALVWPIDHPEIPDGSFGKTTPVEFFDPLTVKNDDAGFFRVACID